MNTSRPSVASRLLNRRAKALQRHLPQAVAGDDRGVHQTRVATRRLREAVPVLGAGAASSHAGKARRGLRRLTRALGSVRELDVALHMLDELARGERVPRSAVEEVRAQVLAERDERRAGLRERLAGIDADKLGRRLSSVAEGLDEAGEGAWRTVLATRLLKRSRRLAEAIEAAGQLYQPDRLHAVRIAAKKLRYGLELAAESGAPAARPLARAIKRTQALLGSLNDYHVLLMHVAAVQASVADRADLHTALAALASHIEGECRHLHGRYLTSVPALLEICAAVPAQVVPQVDRRSRQPLKMAMPARTRARTVRRKA